MPVRNFWIEANIEGRQTKLRGGPRGKMDKMDITLYVRNNGEIYDAIDIICCPLREELLATRVWAGDKIVANIITVRDGEMNLKDAEERARKLAKQHGESFAVVEGLSGFFVIRWYTYRTVSGLENNRLAFVLT